MGIKQYWTKTKSFFKDLFGYKDKKSLEYEAELINLYNSFMSSLYQLYYGFSGQKLQFTPITTLRTNYGDLFSDSIKNNFNLYETDNGLRLIRKNLEERL